MHRARSHRWMLTRVAESRIVLLALHVAGGGQQSAWRGKQPRPLLPTARQRRRQPRKLLPEQSSNLKGVGWCWVVTTPSAVWAIQRACKGSLQPDILTVPTDQPTHGAQCPSHEYIWLTSAVCPAGVPQRRPSSSGATRRRRQTQRRRLPRPPLHSSAPQRSGLAGRRSSGNAAPPCIPSYLRRCF